MGSSSCPTDIDEYWDTALAEMSALDPELEMIKIDFPAKGLAMICILLGRKTQGFMQSL